MTSCGHPLCALIGDRCALAMSVSRGCRTGPGPSRVIADAVFDEVAALVDTIDAEVAADRPHGSPARIAATRLAEIIRREARDDRHVLARARAEELAFVPSLARLCARDPSSTTSRP